jgi:hypothetical protein
MAEDARIIQSVLALNNLQDDRAIGVMACALVDYWLGRAILTRFRPMGSDEQSNLLDNNGNGALATFSAKIWIGYALNLYDAGARSDLLKLKNIRNKFAHSDRDVDFSNPEITALCAKLKAPTFVAEGAKKPEPTDAKTRFLDTVHHLAAGLNMYALLNSDAPAPRRHLYY